MSERRCHPSHLSFLNRLIPFTLKLTLRISLHSLEFQTCHLCLMPLANRKWPHSGDCLSHFRRGRVSLEVVVPWVCVPVWGSSLGRVIWNTAWRVREPVAAPRQRCHKYPPLLVQHRADGTVEGAILFTEGEWSNRPISPVLESTCLLLARSPRTLSTCCLQREDPPTWRIGNRMTFELHNLCIYCQLLI